MRVTAGDSGTAAESVRLGNCHSDGYGVDPGRLDQREEGHSDPDMCDAGHRQGSESKSTVGKECQPACSRCCAVQLRNFCWDSVVSHGD